MKTRKTFLACKAKGYWQVAGKASQAGALLGAGRGKARMPLLCVCYRPGHTGQRGPAGPAHQLRAVFDSSIHPFCSAAPGTEPGLRWFMKLVGDLSLRAGQH